jgi:CheY-like chemotaxis protein
VALKILFADDSMTAQNMGKKILTDAGYEVIAVSNGAQALKKISELKPELIVLDVYMPGYTGLEVCEKVRAARETAKTPVLLTVGKMEPYKPEEGARVKADGVIVKPFEASDLLAAIQKLASQAKAAEPKNGAKPPENQKAQANAVQVEAAAPAHEEPELEVQTPSNIKPSVSIPKDMAGYAAFGFDEELLPSQTTQAPAQPEAAPVPPSASSSAAKPAAQETKAARTDKAPAKAADAIAADFDISNESVSSQPAAQTHETHQAMSAEVGEGKNDLLERFDAVLSSFEVEKAEGFEATAVAPAPGMPVSTETGFEPTARVDQEAETVEVIPEPGLDPFSRSQTDIARSEAVAPTPAPAASSHVPVWEQTGEVSFAVPDTLPEPGVASVTEFIAAKEDELAEAAAAAETASETAPAAAAEVDEFEARVNAAMSAFEAEGSGPIEIEADVAPAIAEREQEEAELAASSHAIESELTGASIRESLDPPVEAIETSHSIPTWTYNEAGASGQSASDYPSDPEIEHTPEPPAFTRAAAASAGSKNDLARAVASAVNPAIAGITTGAQSNSSANSRALKPEVITRIVGQVLEKSLPDILSKVMSEIEKEQE